MAAVARDLPGSIQGADARDARGDSKPSLDSGGDVRDAGVDARDPGGDGGPTLDATDVDGDSGPTLDADADVTDAGGDPGAFRRRRRRR